MDFRIKCLMQTVFSFLPDSEQINYLAQKYITRSLPPSKQTYTYKFNQALKHHEVFSIYKSPEKAVVYEIDCGWHLTMALAFSTFGYRCVKALDIINHVRAESVNAILKYLKEDNRIPQETPNIDDEKLKEELLEQLELNY